MNNWLKNNQPLNSARLIGSIFKQSCVLCQASSTLDDSTLCQACLDTLPLIGHQYCKQCSTPFYDKTNNPICGRCIKQAPYFDETHALCRYQFPFDKLLQHFKYNNALHLSRTLGALMADRLHFTNIDVIVPMPLHINRLRTRGFNQSVEVSKIIHKQTNIPLDLTGCQKVKDIVPQASLAYKERIKNIKKAFACQRDYTGLHVGIIDDVMTTGATLNELSKTIKKAGAARISCYVIARAE